MYYIYTIKNLRYIDSTNSHGNPENFSVRRQISPFKNGFWIVHGFQERGKIDLMPSQKIIKNSFLLQKFLRKTPTHFFLLLFTPKEGINFRKKHVGKKEGKFSKMIQYFTIGIFQPIFFLYPKCQDLQKWDA